MLTDRTALIQFLQRITPMNQGMVSTIAGNFRPRALMKGNFLLKEGVVSDEYLFLENGYMRAFLFDTEGTEVTVNLYSPHSVVFEVSSFFQRVPSQENIIALTDCAGWVISFDDLNTLFHTIPEFRELGRAILVKGFVVLKVRTLSMINKTAEQRYAGLMQTQADLFQHVPLKYIASYLGLTDTSLSRIRKEYSRK
jgi:CRP-like cAMP-binding protein